jgi:Protein of unknown function DUF262
LTTRKRTQKMASTPAQPQMQAQPHPVRIKELATDRSMYENYPAYQRRKVWPLKFQQALINTILLGRNFPSLVAYKEMDATGKQTFWINDGQQRISAIFDFLDNKFRTWTPAQKENAEPNSPPPVEPGKFYKELSPYTKNLFLDYIVNISIDQKTTEDEAREHFRESQNHVSLSPAEKIDTYVSQAKQAAELIENHPFWDDFYMGKEVYRKKIFLSSLYLLALEMAPDGMVDLQATNFIHNLASGKKDHLITEELVDRVISRLDVVSTVFSGAHFTIRAACIPMYQAILIIENTGIIIRTETDRGKLAPWIMGVIEENNTVSGIVGWQRPLQNIVRKINQRAFWDKHRGTVLNLFGLRDAVVQI